MGRRSLIKLFNKSSPNVILCQRNINISSCKNQGNTILNKIKTGQQHNEVPKTCVQKNNIIKDSNEESGTKKKKYDVRYNLYPKISPDVLFFNNMNILSDIKQKNCLLKYNSIMSLNFSTSTKHDNFWNKLLPFEKSVQVPMKLFTHKAEVESLVSEGVGWAGQPIVKRIHPILPEVYGDVSDIFVSTKVLPTSSIITYKESQLQNVPQNNDQPKNTGQLYESDSNNSLPQNTGEIEQSRLDLELSLPIDSNVTTNGSTYNMNKKATDKVNSSVCYKVTDDKQLNIEIINRSRGKKSQPQEQIIMSTGMGKNRILHIKKGVNAILKSGVTAKKSKRKIRKKTKVCNSKSYLDQNFNKIKITKKKKNKVKAYALDKKSKLEPQLLLSHRTNAQSFPKNVLLIENRHLKTYSASYSPRKFDVNAKENSLGGTKNKKQKPSKSTSVNNNPKGFSEDDCECPETFSVKRKKRRTKICGVAAETGEEKKMKKWKGKMCQIVPKVKYRNRTFVCASKNFQTSGRKRQLPKCVKPEKKSVPRVTICAPISITDELQKKSKFCVKPVEEIKVRKRTKVCKPVIIFGKEVTEIKTEKAAVCITGVKKKRSRHTKICVTEKPKNKMQLKN